MATATSERVRKHRIALRESGLRPVQIWVPDTRRAGFSHECQRQSLLLQDDAQERETTQWLAEAANSEGWR
jgi:Protein  of unknown function (DUF3018)